MKRIIGSFLFQFLYWILLFDLTRIAFLLYYGHTILIDRVPLSEILAVFYYSFKLDFATACYIMVFPFLVLLVQSNWSPKWLNYLNKAYTLLVSFIYLLAGVGEMGIYQEWKTKLTYKVVKYLSHPAEIYNSVETSSFFILLLILVVLFMLSCIAYFRFFYHDIVKNGRNLWFSLGFMLLVPPALVMGMRGGLQQIPVNQSQSYYSSHNIMNISSVNNFFNLYISIFENLPNFQHNPYIFMPKAEADALIERIYGTPGDTTINILKINHPNIVMIILESWSADLIESLGGKPGITPEFRELEKEGVLFDRVYASGTRSEQGMASIFAGSPSHPVSCITVQPDKFIKLPSLIHDLKSMKYYTAFYFGGQLIYGNMKSYIMYNGFDKVMEVYDFPDSLPEGKLGIHDQYTLAYLNRDLDHLKEPFFTAIFTVSTHSPFDQPYPKPLQWGNNEREYINSAYYTDHCLGEFFREARKKEWYDSTLFILVADHSHSSYYNWHPQSLESHRIPMLFIGPALKQEFQGIRWMKTGNQHDLPSTLLKQLGSSSRKYRWSKDLFNPKTPDFVYYTTEDGVGWIRPYGNYTWDAGPDYYYWGWYLFDSVKDTVILEGKAYLQEVFREYMEK